MSKPYHAEETLRELYCEREWTTYEIADKFGVTQPTIRHHMDKHGIERRQSGGQDSDGAPWRDEERLRDLYHDKRLNTFEIADKWGCSQGVVHKWLDRFDIERRSVSKATTIAQSKGGDVTYRQDHHGYMTIMNSYEKELHQVRVHRLVALIDHSIDELSGNIAHHKNGVKWDNRPENLEVMPQAEHARHHRSEYRGSEPWHDEDTLRDMYVEDGMTLQEVGDELGCSKSTVKNWLERHGIDRRVGKPR